MSDSDARQLCNLLKKLSCGETDDQARLAEQNAELLARLTALTERMTEFQQTVAAQRTEIDRDRAEFQQTVAAQRAEIDRDRAEFHRHVAEFQQNRNPLPEFKKGVNPEHFLKYFELYMKPRPNDDPYAVMLAACQENADAAEWVNAYSDTATGPDALTTAAIADAFRKRFVDTVRDKKTDKMQALLDNKVKMDAQKGVAEYAARFREAITVSHSADVRWHLMLFRRGLIQPLLAPCRVDYRGREFETLDALIDHAIGEERKWQEMQKKGRALTKDEWDLYLKNGLCTRCGQKGHIAKKCTTDLDAVEKPNKISK